MLLWNLLVKKIAEKMCNFDCLFRWYPYFRILGKSFEQLRNSVKLTWDMLTYFGFLINFKKCSLFPNNICTFLGFTYSSNMTVSLPEANKIGIIEMLRNFSRLNKSKIRNVAKLIGTIVCVCPAIKYGFVNTKYFERQKYYEYHAEITSWSQLVF